MRISLDNSVAQRCLTPCDMLQSYACDDDTFKVEKRGVGQYSLSYSAWGYGNATGRPLPAVEEGT